MGVSVVVTFCNTMGISVHTPIHDLMLRECKRVCLSKCNTLA